jgi:hypothetical protein
MQHVQGRAGQPLLAADHMGDAHQVVVHDVGQVISGHAITLEEHFVVDVGAVHHHPAANGVLEAHLRIARHFQRTTCSSPRASRSFSDVLSVKLFFMCSRVTAL